jgi:DNA-binding response OmpR family regulator
MSSELFALVVEDEHDLSVIFSEALKTAGFTTEVIYDGRAALIRLSEVVPQVVVLDINLPTVSGSEILRQIRSDGRLSKTQVWVLTADVPAGESVEADADVVLLKPVGFLKLSDLATRLGHALS